MPIAINPVFPVIGAQSVAPDAVLQPGTVIDATVLKVLDANLVRIAIAKLSIEVLSEVPLQVGQALQLAVSQTAQGVKLAVVPQQGDASATAAPPASASASPSAPSSIPIADGSPATDSPATNVAPNIAAPKLAPQIDAPIDSRAARPLTNIEALAVSAAVQAAAAKQGSLSPLFANLSVAASSPVLPPALQEAAARLLALRPDLDGNISGEAIKAAFEKSGLFLEQSLSPRGNTTTPVPGSATQTPASVLNAGTPDLKAALIVFRQTVASWLDAAPAPPPPDTAQARAAQRQQPENAAAQPASPSIVPPASSEIEFDEVLLPQASLLVAEDAAEADPKVQIYAPSDPLPTAASRTAAANSGLTSLQEVLQAFPKGVRDAVQALLDAEANVSSSQPRTAAGAGHAIGAETSDVPPPPFRGAAPSAQPIASSTLAHDGEATAVARHLIDDTDAAIARQTLLQVASLPDRVDGTGARPDLAVPRWNFEIPFATPQGTAVAQFEISRDGGGAVSVDPVSRVWKARFSLNVEPSGPVHALVTLSGERTSVRMWAERPATAAQLRANAPQLTHALREAALEPGDIVIGDGAPPQPATPPAGHFLDRAL